MIENFKIKIYRICVPLLVAFPLFMSCGSAKESEDYADGDMALEDTIVSVPVDTTPKVVEKPYRKFHSATEAREFMSSSPHKASYESGILWDMAGENLSYCEKLLNNEHGYFIVVDKASMNVALYDKYGNLKKSYGMACAKNFGTKHKKADCRTPEGFFTAEGIYNSTDWLYTDDDGKTHPEKGVFGPRFIRLKTPVTSQVGIHGTGSPGSIGKRVSHGCIRLTNDNIMDLVKYASAGMPIIVNPSERDRSVNASEGYFVASINTGLKPLDVYKKKVEDHKEPVASSSSSNADSVEIESAQENATITEPNVTVPDTVR